MRRKTTPVLEGQALIVDDEPYYLDWLFEFLEAKHFKVESAVNVEQGCEAIGRGLFKMVIVDLNIPPGPGMESTVAESEAMMKEFPGIYVAQFARDQGHWDDQVIIYSVHMSEAISERAKQLFCTYIPKGRPDVLKEAIVAALQRAGRREERQAKKRAEKQEEAKSAARSDATVQRALKPRTRSSSKPKQKRLATSPNRQRRISE